MGFFADKFAEVDASLDKLQRKLREGTALETGQRGSNKVSALAAGLIQRGGGGGGGKMERSNTASEIMLTKNYGPQMMLGAQRQQLQSGQERVKLCLTESSRSKTVNKTIRYVLFYDRYRPFVFKQSV